ncbi:MAG: DUF3810 domain-containing protein [Ginsengibacter sp.]
MQLPRYFKSRISFWVIAFLLIFLLKVISVYPLWVEKYYQNTFYRGVSYLQRLLFGWVPFSFGDVLYVVGGCWLLYTIGKYCILLFSKRMNRRLLVKKLLQLLRLVVCLYLIFNILWGLNYDSVPASKKLELDLQGTDSTNLVALQEVLLQKVNENKRALIERGVAYPSNKEIFKRAGDCYASAASRFPFLKYEQRSVKSSLFGSLGNYLGFTGYYNPFSGEAQVNTTVPKFLVPYIATHEIGHQLGFAKEDEANFVGYLAAVNAQDTLFQYSAYLDLFLYANREVYYFDSVLAKNSISMLTPAVRADLEEWKKFNLEHTSFIEPVISWMYGKYLKLNKQPAGLRSYNRVIVSLAAYYRKYGEI